MSMYVVKRGGRRESVHFDKITSRISKLCYGLDPKVRRKLQLRSQHFLRYCFYVRTGMAALIVLVRLTYSPQHVFLSFYEILLACGPCRDHAEGHSRSLPWCHNCRA
jgi:hypothetical protein